MTEVICKYCGLTEKHDKRVCRMRKLHADPEFAKANAERMRNVWKLAKAAKNGS